MTHRGLFFHARAVIPAVLALCLVAMPVRGQNPPSTDPAACVGIAVDALRLACYDRALGRDRLHEESAASPSSTAPPPSVAIPPSTTAHGAKGGVASEPARPGRVNGQYQGPALFVHEKTALARRTARQSRPGQARPRRPSLLDSRWELDPDSKLGTFGIRGYKPVYLLPFFYTSRLNDTPSSPSPDHTVSAPYPYNRIEAKFQLSLKTKVWQGVFGRYGDLWLAYTQSSHWQVYNGRISRPFRETNYEPEAILAFETHYHLLGWDGRLLGIGLNHQSNGRSNPLSRSWNRVIADIGLERGPWTVMIRPWWRIPENRALDDNPDISDYMGRAEVQVVREWGAHEFTFMVRHSLRSGSHSHGAVRFSWAFPIHTHLRGYLQVFDGYGESLIDYNHRAVYVGLGISLLGWY